ncbi:MAG: hypothetical protein NBV63_03500 [Candidatus Pacebacteria bacterium]|nr:hypothetical protein [Candidatus Paceibacterota bacterium]
MHHALITDRSVEELCAQLVAGGVTLVGNPDVSITRYGELNVDDARRISQFASLKAVGGGKYFVIAFDRAGTEAQNALLKVVEEAPGDSHFYFSTPLPGSLLPTLRSRCTVEQRHAHDDVAGENSARIFLKATYAERLTQVEKLVTLAQKSGDKSTLKALVHALVHVAPSRDTLDAARYIEQNGSSPKLILSHLAVTLPLVVER